MKKRAKHNNILFKKDLELPDWIKKSAEDQKLWALWIENKVKICYQRARSKYPGIKNLTIVE
jgi:hypothetical protein